MSKPRQKLTKQEVRALKQAEQDQRLYLDQGFAVVDQADLWPEEEAEEEIYE